MGTHSLEELAQVAVDDDIREDVLHRRGISNLVIDYPENGRLRYLTARTLEDIRAHHSDPIPHYHSRLLNEGGPALVINRWDIEGNPLPSYLRFTDDVTPDHRDPEHTTHYIYPNRGTYGCRHPKDTPCNCAKVIDVHPGARGLLFADPTPEIYFCLEGSLKADAILSKGLPVMSAASVTLWKTERLVRPLIRLLKKAPRVYVIPDSNYLSFARRTDRPVPINDNVRYHTDAAVRWLRKQGVQASHMVPPYWTQGQMVEYARAYGIDRFGRGAYNTSDPATRRRIPKRYNIGIDDHLAVGGNLEPWSQDNPMGVHLFQYKRMKVTVPTVARERQDRAAEGAQRFAEWLLGFGGPSGLYMPEDAAEDLGVTTRTIQNYRQTVVDRGVIDHRQGGALMDEYGRPLGNRPNMYWFEFNPEAVRGQ